LRPPHPLRVVLLLVVAQLAFLSSGGVTLLNLACAGFGLLGALTRGVLNAPSSVWPVLLLPVLLLPVLPPEAGPTLALGPANTPFLYRALLLTCLESALLSWLRWEPERQGWLVAAAMTLTMACGLTFEPWPYGGFVVVQVCLLVVHLRASVPGPLDLPRLAPLFGAGVLALSLGLVLAWSERKVNDMMAWFTPPLPISAHFQAHSRLETMRDQQRSARVVLRVFTRPPHQPRHLIGAVYNTYERETWSQRSGNQDLSSSAPPGEDPTFRLSFPPGPVREAYRLSSEAPGSLFVPPGTTEVSARLDKLSSTWDGALNFEPAPGFDGTYRVRRQVQETSGLPLVEPHRKLYLQLPSKLPEVVRREASQRAPGASALRVARATEAWLQDSFEYGLGYPFDPDRDPLEQFLSQRPPAHCEFFATAMTLMLRTRGIPARYVTGFLVTENNLRGGYFTVRESHAHAWTEAWIPGTGWVTFDPTPPGAADDLQEGLSAFLRQWSDLAALHMQDLLARLRSGDWRGLWTLLVETLGGLGAPLARHPLAFGVAVLLGAALAWWGRRSHKPPAPPDPGPLPRLLEDFDRVMALQGPPRPSNLTLLEYRDLLQEDETRPHEASRDFLQAWCLARYAADPEARERLEDLLEQVRRETGPADP